MENVWIVLSLAAGSLQTVRNATSKSLAKHFKPATVTLVRFVWTLPFVFLYLVVLLYLQLPFGRITPGVILFCLATAIFQGVSNTLLIHLFSRKSFAVAMNFFKSDNIFAALVGLAFFGQSLSILGFGAVVLAALGVMYASLGDTSLHRRSVTELFRDPAVWIGLLSGFLMALAAFTIKFSNDAYIGGNVVANSALTLALTLTFQIIGFITGTAVMRKEELRGMLHHIPRELAIGASAAAASICWFLAYSLQRIAYVRTVGQIEFILTLFLTHYVFKERLTQSEKIGVLLTMAGIIILPFVG